MADVRKVMGVPRKLDRHVVEHLRQKKDVLEYITPTCTRECEFESVKYAVRVTLILLMYFRGVMRE